VFAPAYVAVTSDCTATYTWPEHDTTLLNIDNYPPSEGLHE
jgi:hypothetical protein